MLLFCPSCPLSRESSHVVAVLTGWSQICHLMFSSNTHCRLQCIPWLGTVLFQLVWWTPLLRQQSLLIIWSHNVGHFNKNCAEVHHVLSASHVSLAIRLLYLGVGIFPFFQRLMDEAGYEDKHFLHGFPAFFSSVLRLFLAYCHPNLCHNRFSVQILVKDSLT